MKSLEKLPRVDAKRPFLVTVPFKVYHDGNHFVGHEFFHKKSKDSASLGKLQNKELDMLFQEFYSQARQGQPHGRGSQNGVARRIVAELSERGHKDVEDFVTRKIKDELRNVHARKKRFYRKAFLNRWNYFVTLTYSDEKMDADKFREKMRRCLCNLHTRRGWKYMGVYEYGDENGRLHFHALVYVPDGGMIGEIKEKSNYNPKTGRMETRNENSFFTRFGVNDFQQITATEVKHGNAVNYLLKYLEKQQQRIVYSRGIPSEICVNLCVDKLVVKFVDYVEKYVLFDDLIEWERDVMHYQYQYQQMSLFGDVG